MPKAYFLDLGLRNFFKGDFGLYESREDKGALLENALLRQLLESYDKDEIRFWRTIAQKEVDFVAEEKTAYEAKASLKNIKTKDYRLFTEAYPAIKLNFASFDCQQNEVGGFEAVNLWEV